MLPSFLIFLPISCVSFLSDPGFDCGVSLCTSYFFALRFFKLLKCCFLFFSSPSVHFVLFLGPFSVVALEEVVSANYLVFFFSYVLAPRSVLSSGTPPPQKPPFFRVTFRALFPLAFFFFFLERYGLPRLFFFTTLLRHAPTPPSPLSAFPNLESGPFSSSDSTQVWCCPSSICYPPLLFSCSDFGSHLRLE